MLPQQVSMHLFPVCLCLLSCKPARLQILHPFLSRPHHHACLNRCIFQHSISTPECLGRCCSACSRHIWRAVSSDDTVQSFYDRPQPPQCGPIVIPAMILLASGSANRKAEPCYYSPPLV